MYRNLDIYILMVVFVWFDIGLLFFVGDLFCVMGCEVVFDCFFSYFFFVCFYWLVCCRFGVKGVDVLEECEVEVFDLCCVSCVVMERIYFVEIVVVYVDLVL